jgi:hypothetical protein
MAGIQRQVLRGQKSVQLRKQTDEAFPARDHLPDAKHFLGRHALQDHIVSRLPALVFDLAQAVFHPLQASLFFAQLAFKLQLLHTHHATQFSHRKVVLQQALDLIQ